MSRFLLSFRDFITTLFPLPTATISPLSVTSDPSWEVALYDPVVVAPVVCTCFVLIVVFGTVGYFTASSRRIQAETSMENCEFLRITMICSLQF